MTRIINLPTQVKLLRVLQEREFRLVLAFERGAQSKFLSPSPVRERGLGSGRFFRRV
jgi:hypothetical protein